MCADGSKMVVLITGLCYSNCYYCPLSAKKIGKDRIFANEWELDDENDTDKLIKEAELIDAKGAGITGGDPLIVWKRTSQYISLLKKRFGTDFHIHMYTSGEKNGSYISEIVSAGLDEIRFHPDPIFWDNMSSSKTTLSIKKALETDVEIAIEIPAIPRTKNKIFSLIEWSDDMGIDYINLNELEFSETNAERLNKKGFQVKNSISSAVKGSEEMAVGIIEHISNKNLDIGVHYCSSSFKDGVQLKNRIKKRAKNISKPFEVITDEGTILRGIIQIKDISFKSVIKLLKTSFNLTDDQIFINKQKKRVEIPIWILENIAKNLKKAGFSCFIVEEYPTADALEVERIPLPL